MIKNKEIFIFFFLISLAVNLRYENNFLVFNTSGRVNGLSASIATTLQKQFTIYAPTLTDNVEGSIKFTPNPEKKKFIIEPSFVKPQSLLYNDFNQGEFWYGFKKPAEGNKKTNHGLFGLNKVTINNQAHTYLMPFFNLPLSYLDFENLYRCDNVLISFKTSHNVIDLTIFSEQQSWHLFPSATWGFRNRDENVYFSRQTYSFGLNIQIEVGKDKYCALNEKLTKNNSKFQEKAVYTFNEILEKYSQNLEIKAKGQNNQL